MRGEDSRCAPKSAGAPFVWQALPAARRAPTPSRCRRCWPPWRRCPTWLRCGAGVERHRRCKGGPPVSAALP
ncbi:MAG: hypothetical protein IPJ42_00005, partial [Betaproteobacteria bacterium]|nr:hypothetical protein [Betaproteobacteria bacterium]